MALVDQGVLTLKDRVIDHLPDLRLRSEEVAETVTVEQLLNHTSGWRGDLRQTPRDPIVRPATTPAPTPQTR